MPVTRRRLLLGGGAVVLLGAGGAFADSQLRSDVTRAVTRPASSPSGVPTRKLAHVAEGSFFSKARQASTGWAIAYPGDPANTDRPLPFFLVLHGRADDHRAVLGSHALGGFLADAVHRGVPPFAVVAVDGGDHDYWHRRASGADTQAMLVDELLPLVATKGLHTDRFAVGGWSMGGYGALLLAERLGSSRISAIAVDSPAIWTRAGDTAPGAFDSSQDFHEHDVLTNLAPLRRIPVRVSCGTSDPFIPGVRTLLGALPSAERDLGAGGHDLGWWHHAAPGQLAFVGRHLA